MNTIQGHAVFDFVGLMARDEQKESWSVPAGRSFRYEFISRQAEIQPWTSPEKQDATPHTVCKQLNA